MIIFVSMPDFLDFSYLMQIEWWKTHLKPWIFMLLISFAVS